MANTTIKGAHAIHGQNPQYLIENVIRNRIYESSYWKEHCFALTAASLIDRAIELQAVGGVYGNQRPTEFLCLLQKLLQIQPEKEILIEYMQADEFKYLRALAAFYIRMTFRATEVYVLLEPLLKDYRKLRLRGMAGYSLTYMDEFIDALLTKERVCDIILPRIAKRHALEDLQQLGPRRSLLMDVMEGRQRSHSESQDSRDSSHGDVEKGPPQEREMSDASDEEDHRTTRSRSSVTGDKHRSGSQSSSSPSSRASGRFQSRSRSVSTDRSETGQLEIAASSN